jgi:hypothetical protein
MIARPRTHPLVVLLAAALIDIRRCDANAINGSKWLWTLVVLINFIGPLAYILFGRKRPERSGLGI